jgi:uncharacterized protein with ParB-like and HNH nuclease domain
MSITNFNFKKMGEYLSSEKYYIPKYQREYAWERSELEDFWMDLSNVIKEKLELHFLGQIVVHDSAEDKKKFIIDGQQRTCTAVILLSVLRDRFLEMFTDHKIGEAQNNYEDIRIMYIGRWSETKDELRLILGNTDNKFFRKYIQIGDRAAPTRLLPSEKRIKDAYEFFDSAFDALIENIGDPNEQFGKLNEIYLAFINNFKVLYFESNDMNEAFVIFETLNARGKDLETADLLKNHIIRSAKQHEDAVIANWDEMKSTLGKIDATRYIRHLYNSTFDFVREKDLYKKLRDKISSPKKALDFSTGLSTYASTYNALNNPDEDNGFTLKEIKTVLSNLKTMSATIFYPIVLAMVDNTHFKELDILNVVRKLEILVLRNFVIAGRVANIYELKFAEIAYNIHEEKLSNTDEVISEIQKLIIDDDVFLSSFETCSVKKKPVIRYIFKEIIHSIAKEMTVNDDTDLIHIEHIMPVSKGQWDITDEEHNDNLWRLGNLTLLGSDYNEKISNSLFDVKREVYRKSQIALNNELALYDRWTPEEIEDRQKKLAQVAILRWPR